MFEKILPGLNIIKKRIARDTVAKLPSGNSVELNRKGHKLHEEALWAQSFHQCKTSSPLCFFVYL